MAEGVGSETVAPVGSPNGRNVIFMVAERGVLLTAWLVIFGIGVGINASLAFIAVGLFVLLFWNALMTCEVRVGSEAISRRSWFAIANGLPAATFRPTPGRPITLMPDGLWLLDGVAFAPRVAWWEQRRLRRAIDEAGLVVDDEKGAWEQAHRLWSLARWGLFLVYVAAVLGSQVVKDRGWPDALYLPLLSLAAASLFGASRGSPPQTYAPRKR